MSIVILVFKMRSFSVLMHWVLYRCIQHLNVQWICAVISHQFCINSPKPNDQSSSTVNIINMISINSPKPLMVNAKWWARKLIEIYTLMLPTYNKQIFKIRSSDSQHSDRQYTLSRRYIRSSTKQTRYLLLAFANFLAYPNVVHIAYAFNMSVTSFLAEIVKLDV